MLSQKEAMKQLQEKIWEAEYFYSRMLDAALLENNYLKFKFNLSAFLSAARSVLQYALKDLTEASNKSGRQWYNTSMANNKILAFFRDKRDFNIHTEPIELDVHATVEPSPATVHLSVRGPVIKVTDKDGNVLDSYEPSPEEHTSKETTPSPPARYTYSYRFSDWTGSEDLISLSAQYLNALSDIVKEGVSKGFLSG